MSHLLQQRPEDQEMILTVSEFTRSIKQCLEKSFPFACIQGEASNCKLHTSGHLYFSLKDADAQISCVMYRRDVSKLSSIPKDGDQLIAKGSINVYPPSGRYQLTVKELKYSGIGALLLKLEELKQKIKKLGWFDQRHKKPLPKFPKRIGVVTSPTGAAIQDILNVLTRRFSGIHLILNPVKVQGTGAAEEIARAIEEFNRYQLVDVMIVGRGGGSIEDLWAFNEEIVAKAIFESKIPIICAVGHETDHCIAEYVADVRAPTPSAAAEIVIAEKEGEIERLVQLQRQVDRSLSYLLNQQKQKLTHILKQPLIASPHMLLGPWMQRLDDLNLSIDQAIRQSVHQKKLIINGCSRQLSALKPTVQLTHFKQKLSQLEKNLVTTVRRNLSLFRERLSKIQETLSSIDPKNLLKKGYSILFSEKKGSVINSVHDLAKEQKIHALLSDGELQLKIKDIQKK